MPPAKGHASSRPLPRGAGPRSRGCNTCKARKVKCDQTRPACLRCISTNRHCAGYISEADLIFRDELPRLLRKHDQFASDHLKEPSPSKSQDDSDSDSTSSLESLLPSTSLVPYPVPLEHHALAFFTSRYIILEPGTEAEPVGHLGVLPFLLKNATTTGCMYRAVCAMALSALARHCHDPRMLIQARKEYATALSRTNLALRHSEQAILDETLMAVHLLGMFESAMSTTRDLTAWVRHLLGSAALIKMRGPQLLDSRAGVGLFHMAQGQLAICSLVVRKDIFKIGPAFQKRRNRYIPSRHLLDIVFDIPPLLEDLDALAADANRSPKSFQEATKPLLDRVEQLDTELHTWHSTLPQMWRPTCCVATEAFPPSCGSMPTPFFVDTEGVARAEQYVNIWIACVNSFARGARITLLVTWIRTLQDLEESLPPSTDRSLKIQRLKGVVLNEVDSICMSVASTLGCQIDNAFAFTEEIARDNAQAAGGFFLLWPAWNATEVPFMPREQALWLKSWIQFISEARQLVSLALQSK